MDDQKNKTELSKNEYILIKDYVDDINNMIKNGPWKMPLGFFDRIQVLLLSIFVRFSIFSDRAYIHHSSDHSPAYSIIVRYLQKNGVLDSLNKKKSFHNLFFSYFARKDFLINERRIPIIGQGISETETEAVSKALGEIIERIISGLRDNNKKKVSASPQEILSKYEAIYPPKFHRFLQVQTNCYRELHHDLNNKIDWVAGKSLISGGEVYIPKQMTSWLGLGESRVFRDKLMDTTSNGCAGFFTKEGAILRGLFEVIGRDGFLVHYLTMIPPYLIDQNTLPSEIKIILDEFKEKGITVYLLDVTSLGIPSVIAVGINEKSEVQRIVLGGSSAVDFKSAICQSLKEVVMLSGLFSFEKSSKTLFSQKENIKPFISDIGHKSRQEFWVGDKNKMKQFEWFLRGKVVTYADLCQRNLLTGPEDREQLAACLDVLRKLGEDFYPVVYFPKNRIQDDLGFYVAQVFIPKAFPLYLNECYGTFDSDRLQDFALARGMSDWRLNELPHMFS